MMARILYVEDNPQNMRPVRKMLRMGGFENMLEAVKYRKYQKSEIIRAYQNGTPFFVFYGLKLLSLAD